MGADRSGAIKQSSKCGSSSSVVLYIRFCYDGFDNLSEHCHSILIKEIEELLDKFCFQGEVLVRRVFSNA
jgi:hypothetical protein